MRVSDCMTVDLPEVGPLDSLGAAASAMAERQVKAIPVLEGERIVGIVTDWDVTLGVATAEDGGPPVGTRRVGELMSTRLVTCEPDAWIGEASQIMAAARKHHLIVAVDGRYLGMLHLDVDWAQLGDGFEAPTASFLAAV